MASWLTPALTPAARTIALWLVLKRVFITVAEASGDQQPQKHEQERDPVTRHASTLFMPNHVTLDRAIWPLTDRLRLTDNSLLNLRSTKWCPWWRHGCLSCSLDVFDDGLVGLAVALPVSHVSPHR